MTKLRDLLRTRKVEEGSAYDNCRDKMKIDAFLASLVERDGCIAKAARDAGYSRTHADRLLRDSSVIRQLEYFMNIDHRRLFDIKERYLGNLKIMACADLGTMVDDKGRFKGLNKLNPEQTMAIKSVKIKEKVDGSIETEVQLYDKAMLNKLLAEQDGSVQTVASSKRLESELDDMTQSQLVDFVVNDCTQEIIESLRALGYTVTKD